MQKSALCQLLSHLIERAVIDVFRRLRGAATITKCKRLKRLLFRRSKAVFAEAQMQRNNIPVHIWQRSKRRNDQPGLLRLKEAVLRLPFGISANLEE